MIKQGQTFSDTEAKKLFFNPLVAARASLHAVDFLPPGCPRAAGSGHDPASICHCQDKESYYMGQFRQKPITTIHSRMKRNENYTFSDDLG